VPGHASQEKVAEMWSKLQIDRKSASASGSSAKFSRRRGRPHQSFLHGVHAILDGKRPFRVIELSSNVRRSS